MTRVSDEALLLLYALDHRADSPPREIVDQNEHHQQGDHADGKGKLHHRCLLYTSIGISTQKLHARGPLGLRELTSTKYRIYGNGQIR